MKFFFNRRTIFVKREKKGSQHTCRCNNRSKKFHKWKITVNRNKTKTFKLSNVNLPKLSSDKKCSNCKIDNHLFRGAWLVTGALSMWQVLTSLKV